MQFLLLLLTLLNMIDSEYISNTKNGHKSIYNDESHYKVVEAAERVEEKKLSKKSHEQRIQVSHLPDIDVYTVRATHQWEKVFTRGHGNEEGNEAIDEQSFGETHKESAIDSSSCVPSKGLNAQLFTAFERKLNINGDVEISMKNKSFACADHALVPVIYKDNMSSWYRQNKVCSGTYTGDEVPYQNDMAIIDSIYPSGEHAPPGEDGKNRLKGLGLVAMRLANTPFYGTGLINHPELLVYKDIPVQPFKATHDALTPYEACDAVGKAKEHTTRQADFRAFMQEYMPPRPENGGMFAPDAAQKFMEEKEPGPNVLLRLLTLSKDPRLKRASQRRSFEQEATTAELLESLPTEPAIDVVTRPGSDARESLQNRALLMAVRNSDSMALLRVQQEQDKKKQRDDRAKVASTKNTETAARKAEALAKKAEALTKKNAEAQAKKAEALTKKNAETAARKAEALTKKNEEVLAKKKALEVEKEASKQKAKAQIDALKAAPVENKASEMLKRTFVQSGAVTNKKNKRSEK